ncbi:MAG: DoxX family protein [Deltaproteobacteria bacterium]
MLIWLCGTQPSLGALFARIALGVILFAHGLQKAFGLFGGSGFSKTLEFFEQGLGIPPILTVIAILTELIGGIALIFGLLTRIWALGAASLMVVAIWTVHLKNGFFLSSAGNGVEFNLALLGLALSLVAWGGGKFSVDYRFWAEG